MKTLFLLIESSFPPNFSGLYQELGIVAERFDSARNLHRAFKVGWGKWSLTFL